MGGIDDRKDTGARNHIETAFVGALIGGFWGLVAVATERTLYSRLPMTSELIIVAASWFAGAMVGAISAMAFASAQFMCRRVFSDSKGRTPWPGTASVAICVWVMLLPSELGAGSYWTHILSFVAVMVAFWIFGLIAHRYRVVKRAIFWSSITLIFLSFWLVRITLSGTVQHGVELAGALAVSVPFAVAAIPFLASDSRSVRWWIGACVGLVLSVLGAAWFSPLFRGSDRASGKVPATNVVLITVDTLRADYLACYGNRTVQTPFMDRLAQQGVLFENAISPIPDTNPSHTSILTGLYPGNHGIFVNGPIDLAPGVSTMPRILTHSGYKTAAFVSGYTLKRDVCRLVDEFELYDDDFSSLRSLPELCRNRGFPSKLLALPNWMHLLPPLSGYERRAESTVTAARQWLRGNALSPFFLWVHLFDPHSPYTPPAPYNKMYDKQYTGSLGGDFHVFSLQRRLEITRSPKDLEHLKALYAGEVSYVDEQIGGLLAELDAHHLAERTLIILTGDHGESLTEHNFYFGHGVNLYDADLKVPLIIRFPDGKDAGTRQAEVVRLVDILPSVLDYLGIPIPGKIDGESIIHGPSAGKAVDGSRFAVSAILEGNLQGGKSLLAIRTREYKYIRTSPWLADRLLFLGQEELYDLIADPQETRNVLDAKPDVRAYYGSLADEFWKAWFTGPRGHVGQNLSESAVEKLRALGYIR